jgi:RNA polymerase sigma-70 factor, ECF subfamily
MKVAHKTLADAELVVLVKRGMDGAFDELYERYGQKMYSYFYRMLYRNAELAADFTQDLFLKVFRHIDSFEEGRNLSTWLYSIANNMCKNEFRNADVRKSHLAVLQPLAMEQPPESPDMKRFREAVLQCTNGLPEEKKTLFILRFQEGLSVPDISKVMGIAEGTIKSRIFYLLKEMKANLKEFESLSIYP